MTVVNTTKDPDALTLTLVAEFAAPPERVWQLWADPRQLEKWWGPPTWPATFDQHEFTVGGTSRYYMTGPDGEKARGWWRMTAIDEPKALELEDGFSDDSGKPNDEMPQMRMRAEFEPTANGTRMTITTHFASAAEMEKLVGMGMVEGITEAVGQIDGLLAAA
jgi:uncharacterized protein YndB with AHSA1/START domain